MNLDDTTIEVIEYADAKGFAIHIYASAELRRLLGALDIAEDFLAPRAAPCLGRPPTRPLA